jgi:hypothetical protein
VTDRLIDRIGPRPKRLSEPGPSLGDVKGWPLDHFAVFRQRGETRRRRGDVDDGQGIEIGLPALVSTLFVIGLTTEELRCLSYT